MSKLIKFIEKHEGLKLNAYLCPAQKWTIGLGNTFYENGTPVKQGDKITKERAYQLGTVIALDFQKKVKGFISPKVQLTENQMIALTSFAYNIGMGNFRNSTVLRLVNINPNDPAIISAFNRWVNIKGKPSQGLKNRRADEIKMYFSK